MSLHPDIERCALLGWRMVPQTRQTRKGYWKGYRDEATHDLDTLERWSSEYAGCNWCLATGPVSDVWALDVDAPGPDHAGDGITALKALIEKNGPLPERPMLRSGGGGYAIFFRWTPGSPERSRTGWPVPGLDVRGPRVVTTLPPSTHRRTGAVYRWIVAPWDVSPPAAPEWLLKACAPPPERKPEMISFPATTDRAIRRLARACDSIIGAQGGTRNATLNRECWIVGGYVGAGLLHETDAATALYAAARGAGLDHLEAKATIQSGLVGGIKRPLERRA